MMIGLLTPPFGMLLFVTANVGKVALKDLIRETIPLIGVLLVALGIGGWRLLENFHGGWAATSCRVEQATGPSYTTEPWVRIREE